MDAGGVFDRARALNAALPVARLRRALHLYRTWINVGGFDGGFAVSRHELAVALELPCEGDPRVEFLFNTFSVEPSPGQPRVDLVTLLTTAALFSQGSLEDKAALVFSLVDLDTEDDITEHELALVVATCGDGLARLGVVLDGERVSETDAVAIAYEAFEFVGVDVGDKMNFSAFMQWLTSHQRPQALFDRLSCIFSMFDLSKQMQRALEIHKHLADEDPLQYYNWVHLKAAKDEVERIHVVAGPVVGQVTDSTASILLEVDTNATVKNFAFPCGSTARKSACARVQECRLTAFEPQVLIVTGLSPGTTYIFRLLGVCRSDREKCATSVTTFPTPDANEDTVNDVSKQSGRVEQQLTMKFFNHSGQGDATNFSNDFGKQLNALVEVNTGPTVVVHYGLRIPRWRIMGILARLQDEQTQETLVSTVYEMLKECFQNIFVQAGTSSLFRASSNYFVDSAADVLGDIVPPAMVETSHVRLLQSLARRVWNMYTGSLWRQADKDVSAFDLSGIAVLIHCRPSTASMTVDMAANVAAEIASTVKTLPLVTNLVVVADQPLTPDPGKSTQTAFNDAIESIDAARWMLLQSLVELNKVELSTKLCLVAFSRSGGYQTVISVKDTKVSINQLVCGPSNNLFNVRMASHQEQTWAKLSSGAVSVQHSKLDYRPQIGQITSPYEILKATKKRLAATRSARIALVPLLSNLQPELTLGPVVGFISHSSAKILVESSDDVEVDCVLTGRLIGDTKVSRQRTQAHRPAIFVFDGLRPGSVYDISFPGMASVADGAVVQTPFKHSPAFRLMVLSEDSALDGSILEWTAASDASSFLHDISSNILSPAIDLQSDLVLHLGCIASVAQTLGSILQLWNVKVGDAQHRAELRSAVRNCVRRHWNLSENRDVLSRGSHWFSSVGVVRSLLTRHDVPLGILHDICEVFREYEQAGRGSASDVIPAEQVAFRLQHGAVLLTLDTMQAAMDSCATNPFNQFPDTLVSTWQWEALEYWFEADLSGSVDAHVNAFIIVCDLALANAITAVSTEDPGRKKSSLPPLPAASSWNQHPSDQHRLLDLIFRRLHTSPGSCVLFIACGSTSACATVTELSTGRSFQHIVVGPVSQFPARASETASARGPLRIGTRYMIEFDSVLDRIGPPSRCHYSTVDVVPHPLGAEAFVRQYTDSQPSARIIVGPVVGRVTIRTARILIELDRQAENLVCALVDPATGQRVTTEASVKAFAPTILKIEGLRPGTRYRIEFEGILKNNADDAVHGYVNTPSPSPLATEWIVVNHNAASEFLAKHASASDPKNDEHSYWDLITTRGMRAFNAQASSVISHKNGDTLGQRDDVFHTRFNPWHRIQDNLISDPLISPQLLLHLGGQVDMRLAFADGELIALVQRIAPLQSLGGGLTDKQVDSELDRIRHHVRHRMQEVYRVYWSAPPMKTLFGQASNFMFLDLETDVCFTSAASLRDLMVKNNVPGALELDEAALHAAASLLLGVAFELWQLYQNQLWADLLERDLEFGNRSSTSKLAFASTYGLTRLVFMNANPEVYAYCSKVETNKHAKGVDAGDTYSDSDDVNLFSTATWKVFDEAVENTASDSNTSKQKGAFSRSVVQQLVAVVSADLVEWGGTNSYPKLRMHIIRVLETVFTWKLRDRDRREVTLIGRSANGSSMSYIITDEKTSEKIRLLVIGSISRPRELIKAVKRTTEGSSTAKSSSATKGYFSKRFTYRSALNAAAGASKAGAKTVSKEMVPDLSLSAQRAELPALYRTFASFQYLTDLRRGSLNDNLHFFPPNLPPKVVVGPVLGRMTTYYVRSVIPSDTEDGITTADKDANPQDDRPEQTTCLIALPLLLEIDASARVTCVVSDALTYQEVRVTEELTRYVPHIFTIRSLQPERRYVYRLEGVANADSRRGSFHTPPSSSSLAPINFICTSSNFPEHLDGSTDSLWAPIHDRVALPWSGIDFVVHVGGQVPLQEAVIECAEWVSRELRRKYRRRPSMKGMSEGDGHEELKILRKQVRKRMQQHYRRVWNLPNLREVLASCSNWFLRAQADVAPFFGNYYDEDEPSDYSDANCSRQAARIVLEEARCVVNDYQLALMREVPVSDVEGTVSSAPSDETADPASSDASEKKRELDSVPPPPQDGHESSSQQLHAPNPPEPSPLPPPSPLVPESDAVDAEDCAAQLVQHGNTAFFVCDMRSARRDDVVTCNGRLQTPLTRQEHAIIGERQWQQLENALKVKKTHVLVLLLELPLVLTSAEHVDKMREEQRSQDRQSAEGGKWSLYDLPELTQHWVSCRRQLEQLLHVLFRWKLKRRGRDVLVVSGAMRVGIDSLVRDAQSGLSLRSVSVGPITARVEPFTLPASGVACPEFLPKAAPSTPGETKKSDDSRFTFTHSTLVAKRNYVLAQIAIQQDGPGHSGGAEADEGDTNANGSLATLINATFVSALDADPLQNPDGLAIAPSAHPVDMYRRPPSWWKRYIPMGKSVFWDDTVSLRAASDDELLALCSFIDEDRALASALEVCYDKYQFAEAARLEELRSAHARQRLDLMASLRRVFTELWRLVPDQKRRRMAYILDPYVSELLLDHIRASDAAMSSFLDGGAVELNAFARLCRSVLWSACLLRLSVTLYEEDRLQGARQRWQRKKQQQLKQEVEGPQPASSEAAPTAETTKEARKQGKLDRKRAERLHEAEEELAIAREQQRLNRLADSGAASDAEEFARTSVALETRIRALGEAKKQREAEREMRSERKQRKREGADRDAGKKKATN